MHIPGYQIERELGQGGMAIVYLALQESLNRHVALKVIKPVLTTDEEFAQRFLREGRIIAQLNDAHIVTVYDIASHDNIYYLSMEYLPGGTLQQRIREGLSLKDAIAIARAIAGALHYAHRRHIIHRDIKPQNILFRENGSPVLTDFGIAKTIGGSTIMTRTGLSIGTPRYMSPEQIRGQTVDARADLYSLGVLFHELLTGNVPYTAEDSFALAMMHVTAPIPELPAELTRFQPLLNKLMDKNPDQRFQTGQDIIAALDALETPTGLTGTRESLAPDIGHPAPPASRLGRKIAIPLAAALVGAAVAGGYLFLNRPAPAPPAAPPLAHSPPARPPEPSPVDLAAQRKAQADQLLADAIRHQQTGALADSLARIEQGLKIVPDHPVLLALRDQVNRQIADEDRARQARLQAEQFLEQAQRARQEGALDMGLVHIEQGLQALPDHAALLALKQDLLALKSERQRQRETARRQAELEERQRLEAERQRIEATERQRAEADQRRRKADEFLGRALGYQRDRVFEVSLLQIEQGLQQVPDHPRLLALREEVRRQLREAKVAPPPAPPVAPPLDDAARIAALLRQCEAHLKANRLTSGKGGNAADCYEEVLRRDRGNSEALTGLDRVAERQAELAAAALRRGDLKSSRSALDRLARLNPSHLRLAELREELAEAEAAKRPPPAPAPPVAPAPVAADVPEPPPRPPEKPAVPAPEPAPAPRARPAQAETPPIDLVSLPHSTPTPATAEPQPEPDQPTRIAKTEIDKPETTSGEQPRAAPEPAASPRGAEQAWAALEDSTDAAEIERFLATYPKSRQATAARAKLKQLRQQPGLPARLAVDADVEDAQVSLNGRAIGTTPIEVELKPGSYRVRVSRQGYQDWNERVDLTGGVGKTLTAVLPRKLSVATAPPASQPPQTQTETEEPEPEPTRKTEPSTAEKPAAKRDQPPPPSPETKTAKLDEGSSCLSGNCRNGQGTYRHPDGSEYSGEFRNAKMHGQGTYIYARRGEKYVGEWRDGAINGEGTYFYRSGNRYQGEWRNGRKNGQGAYFYASGEKYVGEFENDQPNGRGIYYYRNGDRYEGEWRNGQKHGQGIMYENGKKIVGEWRDDQKVRVSVEQ